MFKKNILKIDPETFEPLEFVFERNRLYHLSLEKGYFDSLKKVKNSLNILDHATFQTRYFYYKYIFQNTFRKFLLVLIAFLILIGLISISLRPPGENRITMTRGDLNIAFAQNESTQNSSQQQFSSEPSLNIGQSITQSSNSISSSKKSTANISSSPASLISSSTPPPPPPLILGLKGYGCKYSYNNPSDPIPPGDTMQCFLINKTTNTPLIQIRDCTLLASCFFNSAIYLGYRVGNVQQIIEYTNPDYTGAGYTYAAIEPKPITPFAGGGTQRYQYLKMFFYNIDTKSLVSGTRLTLKISAYSLTFCDPKVSTNYTIDCFPECNFNPTPCLAETKLNNDTFFLNYNKYVPSGLNLDFY